MIEMQERVILMERLGHYLKGDEPTWAEAKELAERQNGWFTQDSINLSVSNIADFYLEKDLLAGWLEKYPLAAKYKGQDLPELGIVMAGNLPLVGFHDFLCGFMWGLPMALKLSSKDTVLWEHILALLIRWDNRLAEQLRTPEMLKGCGAYIATGSNNSARYFEQYFSKYPSVIRKNRTSIAVLDGSESKEELDLLAGDICTYFGLGCRNVTQVIVPRGYSFLPLLEALNKYAHHIDHNKYKNNYDYQLALALLNKVEYMTNGSVLLMPSESPYAAISVLNYAFYETLNEADGERWDADDRLQCIVSGAGLRSRLRISKGVSWGTSQAPSLTDYADGIDTMAFLSDWIEGAGAGYE